jgi:hypothetical protein
MSSEHEPSEPTPVEAIHYYPKTRSLVIEVAGGPLFALVQTPEGIFYELIKAHTRRSVERLEPEPAAQDAPRPAPAKEKAPTTIIPGKLQNQPVEGRPDRHGKPTAYARLLGHLEGEEGATLLSTSFHGKTRDIALVLAPGSRITAQGYLHRSSDPDRLSSFSVVHLLEYPGKVRRLTDD